MNTQILRRPESPIGKLVAALPFSSASTRQDGYPPPFFKRLDKFIERNGFRARDVYLALDRCNSRSLSYEEIVTGLNRMEFHVSQREKRMLKEWMDQIVGHDLTFKDFVLALKQRASLTSPQRISILKLAHE